MTVVEASGGSTGSSLAFVCAVMGYTCLVVSSDAFAVEKIRTMRSFGAEVEVVESASGKITGEMVPVMMRRVGELVEGREDCWLSDQFHDRDALIGYEEIGHELVEQFPGGIDAFCGAVGVAGMAMGVVASSEVEVARDSCCGARAGFFACHYERPSAVTLCGGRGHWVRPTVA